MEDHTSALGRPFQPMSGDVYRLGTAASVQFGFRPILFRVIKVKVKPGDTYDGWVWLDGYELNEQGNAVERRSVFVRLAGLVPVHREGVRSRPVVASGRNQRQMQPGKPARPGVPGARVVSNRS